MSGPHKHPPIGFRPPAGSDDREWLLGYSARTGRAVNAILTEALRLFRAQVASPAPVAAGDEQPSNDLKEGAQ